MPNFLEKVENRIRYELKKLKPIGTYLDHKRSPKPSYAQCQEDLVAQSLIGRVEQFIDIGAYDGLNSSNTFLFALQGAKGMCFEPIPSTFLRLKNLYFFNFNVKCIQEGISRQYQSYKIKTCGPFSSIDETHDPLHREIVKKKHKVDVANEPERNITVRPLSYWLEKYPNFSNTDLISIDVEGHELMVLQGIEFSQLKAKCFIIETHSADLSTHEGDSQINKILEEARYFACLKNEFNTFWIQQDLINPTVLDQTIKNFQGYRKIL